jgi:hypothetical protein
VAPTPRSTDRTHVRTWSMLLGEQRQCKFQSLEWLMATSKSDASKAGKLLASKSASKTVKSVAASDLAQAKKSGSKKKK